LRQVSLLAKVDREKCTGCKICEKVCPTLVIKVVDKKAVVDEPQCTGCGGCEQRCPARAITLIKRDDPYTISFPIDETKRIEIDALCRKAKFHPEQIVCYCTETRAEEVAASVLAGNDTPEKVSATTGIRTGCKIECIQPILRLLNAAGYKPTPPEGGYQWYGLTPTIYDIPQDVKDKYQKRGFFFDDDIRIFEEVIHANEKED
jgi:Fe-S-cluster-containing hydrogenase component 2